MVSRLAAWLAWTLLGVVIACLLVNVAFAVANMSGPDPVAPGATLGNGVLYVAMLSFAVVGVRIALHKPENPIGWIMLVIALVWQLPSEEVVRYGIVTAPGSVPRPDVLAVLTGPVWVPGIGLIGTFLLLLFPDGHLPSRRWRPVAWFSGLSLVLVTMAIVFAPLSLRDAAGYGFLSATAPNPLGIAALEPFVGVLYGLVLLVPVSILACAISIVMRFRRAGGREREQLKWLAVAAGVSASLYVIVMVLSSTLGGGGAWAGGAAPAWLATIQNTAVLVFVCIPVAVGIAILRYRLYDIDRIISRTLAYAVIIAVLGAIYVMGILVLSRLFSPLAPDSQLAVAGSTLAVAGAFGPVRRRVQAAVDRRFNRAHYDARRTVESFATRLRNDVKLDDVSSDLVATVQASVQPAAASLWLRPSGSPRPGHGLRG